MLTLAGIQDISRRTFLTIATNILPQALVVSERCLKPKKGNSAVRNLGKEFRLPTPRPQAPIEVCDFNPNLVSTVQHAT